MTQVDVAFKHFQMRNSYSSLFQKKQKRTKNNKNKTHYTPSTQKYEWHTSMCSDFLGLFGFFLTVFLLKNEFFHIFLLSDWLQLYSQWNLLMWMKYEYFFFFLLENIKVQKEDKTGFILSTENLKNAIFYSLFMWFFLEKCKKCKVFSAKQWLLLSCQKE